MPAIILELTNGNTAEEVSLNGRSSLPAYYKEYSHLDFFETLLSHPGLDNFEEEIDCRIDMKAILQTLKKSSAHSFFYKKFEEASDDPSRAFMTKAVTWWYYITSFNPSLPPDDNVRKFIESKLDMIRNCGGALQSHIVFCNAGRVIALTEDGTVMMNGVAQETGIRSHAVGTNEFGHSIHISINKDGNLTNGSYMPALELWQQSDAPKLRQAVMWAKEFILLTEDGRILSLQHSALSKNRRYSWVTMGKNCCCAIDMDGQLYSDIPAINALEIVGIRSCAACLFATEDGNVNCDWYALQTDGTLLYGRETNPSSDTKNALTIDQITNIEQAYMHNGKIYFTRCNSDCLWIHKLDDKITLETNIRIPDGHTFAAGKGFIIVMNPQNGLYSEHTV